jgi:hypothetical protein
VVGLQDLSREKGNETAWTADYPLRDTGAHGVRPATDPIRAVLVSERQGYARGHGRWWRRQCFRAAPLLKLQAQRLAEPAIVRVTSDHILPKP